MTMQFRFLRSSLAARAPSTSIRGRRIRRSSHSSVTSYCHKCLTWAGVYFEIFGVDDGAAVGGFVVLLPQADEIILHCLPSVLIEAFEGHLGRSEIGPEQLDDLRGTVRKVEVHHPPGHLKLNTISEALRNYRFVSPKNRRSHTLGRRHVSTGEGERPANKSSWRPVTHRDQASGTTHAQELGGNTLRTGREHRAKHGEHNVKLCRVVR